MVLEGLTEMFDAHTLAQPFEGWKHLYSHSTTISTTILTLHLGSMFVGGGLALAADRMTLRVSADHPDERARQLAEVAAVHRAVLIGIALLLITGVALSLADLENFLTAPVFWIKLILVVLLLVNGALLQRSESRLRRSAEGTAAPPSDWGRLRTFSVLSIVLWLATFVVGSLLTNAS
ncbi:MAG TPA: hypothetical protein VGM67_14090 [Gemmatimonadaceae bacterium]